MSAVDDVFMIIIRISQGSMVSRGIRLNEVEVPQKEVSLSRVRPEHGSTVVVVGQLAFRIQDHPYDHLSRKYQYGALLSQISVAVERACTCCNWIYYREIPQGL